MSVGPEWWSVLRSDKCSDSFQGLLGLAAAGCIWSYPKLKCSDASMKLCVFLHVALGSHHNRLDVASISLGSSITRSLNHSSLNHRQHCLADALQNWFLPCVRGHTLFALGIMYPIAE